MKRLTLGMSMLVAGCMMLTAQEPDNTQGVNNALTTENVISRNLFLETGGNSGYIGVGYDQRFRAGSRFGFHVGIGYDSGGDGLFGSRPNFEYKGAVIPFEINYLVGSLAKKSRFEVGLGLNFSANKVWHHDTGYNTQYRSTMPTSHECGAYLSANLGYRYQQPRGFFLRTGISAGIIGVESGQGGLPERFILRCIYLGLGYTF